MSTIDTADRGILFAPWGGAGFRVADGLLAAVVTAVTIYVGSTHSWGHSAIRDVVVLGRFFVVFVALWLGLVVYHRMVERRHIETISESTAKELTRAKDQFLANVSHGLRTPLTGIVGFAHILEASINKADDREALNTILGEAADLSRIVDDLVVAARLDADSLTVQLEDVSFADQLEPVLQYMDLIGAQVAVDCPDVRVRVDPELYRQMLRNLLANAHRHGRPQLRVEGQVAHGRFVCHVVDHGSGVPADLQNRLFKRFPYRSQEGITGHVGLGLAVVQELSERMGCHVGYRRIRGQTHFLISAPLALSQAGSQDDSPAPIGLPDEWVERVGDRLLRMPA